jgi:hypothetical protein
MCNLCTVLLLSATYSLGFEVDIMQFSQDHIIYTFEASLSIVMAVLRVYKRNSMFMDLAELVDQISKLGLVDALQKYRNKPLEKEAKSIVAGPSFLQYLNKLFQIQISAGDIIQFESGNTSKYYMLSATGTWDEIIKLQ